MVVGPGSVLRCPAPAKLNLFLLVTGRRPDGLHTLQTLFRFIDYCDELTFRLRPEGEIRRVTELPGIAESDDLAVRAARLLQAETGCGLGVEIANVKRLPVGGGLGGGSSDAATTLIALNRLWDLHLARGMLQELALRLGADVPVFVFGRNALAEGVGEQLQAIELPSTWYLVLVPPVAVSTASVFAELALTRSTTPVTIRAFSEGCDPSGRFGRNDLEPVVCRRYPEVAHHLDWLRRFGPAALTGSGACVYCAFDSEASARSVLAQLPAGMQGFVAAGLPQHPLLDWTL
ncbi:MAG TPA: 4-(cytidine 5'-diphospho)-2-C-methyl-D-erythritol kinase [Burkholderiales bacterium]|nr:4-(cytidine 5'-diphospho)-2-C-methyl-D-erythritol kinase [Burkholderiales bacterium]